MVDLDDELTFAQRNLVHAIKNAEVAETNFKQGKRNTIISPLNTLFALLNLGMALANIVISGHAHHAH